jgi:hypothetical protein
VPIAASAPLEALKDIGYLGVADFDDAFDRALGRVGEPQGSPRDLDVLLAEGGQAEGLVLLDILFATNPKATFVEKSDRTGENSVFTNVVCS